MNRPPEVPEAYLFYKGDWCHPSRVPKDMKIAAQVIGDGHMPTSHDAAAMCEIHNEAANMRVAKAHPPKRIRQSTKPLMNKLESEFKHYYETYTGHTLLPQAIRFRLGNGIWYKPDFTLFCATMGMSAIEVKGPFAHRGGFENLKVAAGLYKSVTWRLAWKLDGVWKTQIVYP